MNVRLLYCDSMIAVTQSSVPHPFARFLGEWVGKHELNKSEFMQSESEGA
jgi:hypothetical protein